MMFLGVCCFIWLSIYIHQYDLNMIRHVTIHHHSNRWRNSQTYLSFAAPPPAIAAAVPRRTADDPPPSARWLTLHFREGQIMSDHSNLRFWLVTSPTIGQKKHGQSRKKQFRAHLATELGGFRALHDVFELKEIEPSL